MDSYATDILTLQKVHKEEIVKIIR